MVEKCEGSLKILLEGLLGPAYTLLLVNLLAIAI
jgi:hypothetical protein